VVLAANLGAKDLALYAEAGARVVDHGMHLHRVVRRPLQMVTWPLVRRLPDSGSFTPPLDRLQQPNVLRWSLYRRYLQRHRQEIDRVAMLDLRDSYFQDDPFRNVVDDSLRIHAEEGDITVERSPWNAVAMRRAYGTADWNKWCGLRVSCSGAVSGGIGPVVEYLEAFGRLLHELRLPDHGTDQAVHIRLVHGEVAGLARWQDNRRGDVVHLAGVADLSTIPRDDAGLFLDASGTPYAVVHQFDRHPALADQGRAVVEPPTS
jgi:hypothetical protein